MAINWRHSQRLRHAFLDDDNPRLSGFLWRTLEGKWAWAVRDMTTEPMTIKARGEHRNRVKAALQYEAAKAQQTSQ